MGHSQKGGVLAVLGAYGNSTEIFGLLPKDNFERSPLGHRNLSKINSLYMALLGPPPPARERNF